MSEPLDTNLFGSVSVHVVCDESPHYDRAAGTGKRPTIVYLGAVAGSDGKRSAGSNWHALKYPTASDKQEAKREGDASGGAATRPRTSGEVPESILQGNRRLASRGEMVAASQAGELPRRRYDLACPLCGLTVPVRFEKLSALLDRLLEAGAIAPTRPLTLSLGAVRKYTSNQ